ncbi:hypothetical protein ACFLU6_11110 [Acidobacteriota bacterium]
MARNLLVFVSLLTLFLCLPLPLIAQCGDWDGSDVYELVISRMRTIDPDNVELTIYNPADSGTATFTLNVIPMQYRISTTWCSADPFIEWYFSYPVDTFSCTASLSPGEHVTIPIGPLFDLYWNPNIDFRFEVEYEHPRQAGLVEMELMNRFTDPSTLNTSEKFDHVILSRRDCY